MTQYLIDTVTLSNNHLMAWHSTHDTLEAASEAFEALGQDRNVVAATIIRWTPGGSGGKNSDLRCEQGNWSSRNCRGGVPKAVIVRHAERVWGLQAEGYGPKGPRFDSPISSDEWYVSHEDLEVTTQPSPGFTMEGRYLGYLSSTKLDKALIDHPTLRPVPGVSGFMGGWQRASR